LIADTETAFAKDNPMRGHYDTDCLTTYEFKNILNELYKNGYILIKASSIFDSSPSPATKKKLFLPQGKKPVILSFDDVNYDQKKSGRGMVDKIALDKNDNLITYTNANPEPSYNNEFITILENFWNKFNLSYEVPSVIYEKFRNYYDGFEKIYFARDDYLNRTIHFHDCGMDNYKRYLNYAEYLGFYGIHNPDCKIITDAHDCGLKHDNLKFVSNDKEMIREINSLKISFPVIIEFKSLN
jgi:hypothetical protein